MRTREGAEMLTVVGFRLGNGTRHATVVVTESGRLHRAHGPYGAVGRASRPDRPVGQNAVHRQMGQLRSLRTRYMARGYVHELVPGACVRLDLEEPASQPAPGKRHDREPPWPALFRAFDGAAPAASRDGLERAIDDFYTTIGAPFLPRRPDRPAIARPAARLPLRVAALRRVLAGGSAVSSSPRLAVGYTVTADHVRLHVGRAGESLPRQDVVELHAALSAWLHLNTAN
ncbi:hypothetical protein ACF068_10620 [Streptomyces sp. NPDC016309]|uniref:hypothetical protein n=1 Tax=Streptomyces sp. NPDC016309 TaxID=3364965 RepID=UPI0036FDF112